MGRRINLSRTRKNLKTPLTSVHLLGSRRCCIDSSEPRPARPSQSSRTVSSSRVEPTLPQPDRLGPVAQAIDTGTVSRHTLLPLQPGIETTGFGSDPADLPAARGMRCRLIHSAVRPLSLLEQDNYALVQADRGQIPRQPRVRKLDPPPEAPAPDSNPEYSFDGDVGVG